MPNNTLHVGSSYLLEKILSDIDSAKKIIHIQMYIILDDEVGNAIKTKLIEAAKRNVKIYIVADAYGSLELPKYYINDLRENGIYFRFFNQFVKKTLLNIGRRLHHKIITIDNNIGYVGGINLSNYYFLNTPWLDFMVRTTDKSIIKDLSIVCNNILKKEFFTRKKTIQNILINDYFKGKNEISKTYYKLINQATKDIIIIAAYFFPSLKYRKALSNAAKRGVNIIFITGKKSDVLTFKYAMEFLYTWLLKKNIKLYEYQPSIVHGKLLAIDNQYLTVGSYNFNKLSDNASIEMNLLFKNVNNNRLIFNQFNTICNHNILKNVKSIPLDYTKNLVFWKKIRNYLSYHIIRWGLIIITYFSKNKNVEVHLN